MLQILFMSALSFAAVKKQYYVQSKILENGKPVAAPEIVVTGGESAAVEIGSQEHGKAFAMLVDAQEAGGGKLLLKFAIDYNDRLYKTEVVAPEGKEAELALSPTVQMKVMAKRR